ncbi:MAG: helix-turn-helix domain-containing protein [Kiritimatiellae bacterium]|nr:helix-turn-helix domain-containing protein [Kiritimatiellia bacterium]
MMRSRARLSPTLWRTCRALANRQRLRILHQFTMNTSLTVSDVVRQLGIPEPLASRYLRALNARGILQVRRAGREVFYRLDADPSVPHAAALIRALRVTLNTRSSSVDKAFAALTGFTHPRRIVLVQALLADRPLTLKAITIRNGIPLPAAVRHLRKLTRRGYVVKTKTGYRRAKPRSLLHKTLLALALKA